MSQKRIRLTPITASVSFTEISPSKRRRRKKCIALPLVTTSTLVNADSEVEEPEFDAEEPEIDSPDSSQQARSYPLRQEKLCEAWSEIREQLRRVLIESNVSGIGNNCSTCDQKALIICQQCGPQVAFCEECTELRHLTCNLFHHPQLFKVQN